MKNFIEMILNKYGIEYKEIKNGRELLFRCPFHDDRHASMSINAENGYYNCFSCHAGGRSVESFVKKLSGETIVLSDFISDDEQLQMAIKKIYTTSVNNIMEIENYIEFNKIIMSLCSTFVSASMNDMALGYLQDKRQFTKNTIKDFKLMFCKNGDYQNRVIIPYYQGNNILGFNSRLIGADKGYLKDLRYRYLIDKKKMEGYVYQLDRCVSSDYCILVEGPFDLMYMKQAGIKNVISTLTTNVSFKHIENLTRFKKFIFCFDNDDNQAGKKATLVAAKRIYKVMPDVDVLTAKLPPGKDPNECSPDELKECISKLYRIKNQNLVS
jgi:DNA primase